MATALLSALLGLVLGASFAAGGEPQSLCREPAADLEEFACGMVAMSMAPDAPVSVDEVLARTAPRAEIDSSATAPDGSSMDYTLRVPIGEEWQTVLGLRADPDVLHASLMAVGQVVTPDTAMAEPRLTDPGRMTVFVAALGLVLLWQRQDRRSAT